jgi:hypothetical protein
MKLLIRTKDDLVKLLSEGISFAWRIDKSRLGNITDVEIYNFSGNSKIVGAYDLDRTKVLENGRVAVAFSNAKIEPCEFKWVGQYPIKYKTPNNEELELTKDEEIDNDTESNLDTVEKIAEGLKNNFLFQASLGSKELFHSNMLAWILEQQNESKQFEALKIFIEEVAKLDVGIITEENNPIIAREENKIDLTIKWKEGDNWNLIFIENKMKSIPTIDQLEKYDGKIDVLWDSKTDNWLDGRVRKKYILTPFPSKVQSNSKIMLWENITYSKEILDFFNKLLNDEILFANADIKNIIYKYIDFIENQNKLLWQFNLADNINSFNERKYDFYTPEIYNQLTNLRLHDLILKLAHQKIGLLIEEQLSTNFKNLIEHDYTKFKDGTKKIFIDHSFSRGSGISTVSVLIKENQAVSLQLQEGSLRYFSALHKKGGNTNINFAKKLVEKKLWFYDLDGELLSGNGRKNKDILKINDSTIFNSYGLNFIYLNKNVSEYNDKPISDLVDLICGEVKRVIDNFDKFEKLI